MSDAQDGTDDLFGDNTPVGYHNQSAIISPDDVERMVANELSPNDSEPMDVDQLSPDRMVGVVLSALEHRQPSPTSTDSGITTAPLPNELPIESPPQTKKKANSNTRCHFFLNGKCRFGDKCSFSHSLPPMLGPEGDQLLQANVEQCLQHENEILAKKTAHPKKSKRHYTAYLAVAAERDVARKQLRDSDLKIADKFRTMMAAETDPQVKRNMAEMIADYERVVANHDEIIELLRGREAEMAVLAKDLKKMEQQLKAHEKKGPSDATEPEAEKAETFNRLQRTFRRNMLASERGALVQQRDAEIAALKQQIAQRGGEYWDGVAAASRAQLAGVPASQQAAAAGAEGRTKRRKVGGEKRKRELGDVGLHSGGSQPGAKAVRVDEETEGAPALFAEDPQKKKAAKAVPAKEPQGMEGAFRLPKNRGRPKVVRAKAPQGMEGAFGLCKDGNGHLRSSRQRNQPDWLWQTT